MRRGFTLIEMLVVLAIIAVLLGIAIPAYVVMQRRARTAAAAALVGTVANAISAYQKDHLHLWYDPAAAGTGTDAMYRAWDVDGDGSIDGDQLTAWFWAPPPAAGDRREQLRYLGFVATVRPDLPRRAIDPIQRTVIDPWNRPLRIAYARHVYGTGGFGVWSAGRNGVDEPEDTGDDLRSWGRR